MVQRSGVFFHDWTGEFSIKLTYETVISASYVGVEQRRAMRSANKPQIEVHKTMLLNAAKMRDLLSRQFNQELYIPLDVEWLKGTRGTNKITAITALTNHYFLKNISGLYLMDEDENRQAITGISGQDINLAGNLAGTSNFFYPAIKAFTRDLPANFETDMMVKIDMTFEQILS